MELSAFMDILHMAEKLKCNTRHCYTSSGRHESVAEHSFRLAFMALFMKDEFPGLDMQKVISMCLIHDLGEAITGDIPAFYKTQADTAVENQKLQNFVDTWPNPYREEMTQLYQEMEKLETPEAKLYKALDKLEALISHNESDLSTWLPLEYELQMAYGQEECEWHPYLKKLRELVKQESIDKIEKEDREKKDANDKEPVGKFEGKEK